MQLLHYALLCFALVYLAFICFALFSILCFAQGSIFLYKKKTQSYYQMRASTRISVLGESGNPCIADNGPSEDHITVIFPGDGLALTGNYLAITAD